MPGAPAGSSTSEADARVVGHDSPLPARGQDAGLYALCSCGMQACQVAAEPMVPDAVSCPVVMGSPGSVPTVQDSGVTAT